MTDELTAIELSNILSGCGLLVHIEKERKLRTDLDGIDVVIKIPRRYANFAVVYVLSETPIQRRFSYTQLLEDALKCLRDALTGADFTEVKDAVKASGVEIVEGPECHEFSITYGGKRMIINLLDESVDVSDCIYIHYLDPGQLSKSNVMETLDEIMLDVKSGSDDSGSDDSGSDDSGSDDYRQDY